MYLCMQGRTNDYSHLLEIRHGAKHGGEAVDDNGDKNQDVEGSSYLAVVCGWVCMHVCMYVCMYVCVIERRSSKFKVICFVVTSIPGSRVF